MSIIDYMPGGLSPESLALILTGLSAGLIVFAIWQTLLVRDPQGDRIKALAERRAALKAGLTAPPQRRQKQVRGLGFMRNVVARFSLVRTRQADKVQVRLARAGFRSKDAPIIFMFCKLLMPMAFGALAVVVIYVLQAVELKPMMRLVAMVGSVIVGFYAPDIFVKNLATKRQKALRKGLPDFRPFAIRMFSGPLQTMHEIVFNFPHLLFLRRNVDTIRIEPRLYGLGFHRFDYLPSGQGQWPAQQSRAGQVPVEKSCA